jgi:hypothetical protein
LTIFFLFSHNRGYVLLWTYKPSRCGIVVIVCVRRLVRLLAEVGQSVLVVSYTHSAVDTLLCKLAAESTTGSSCLENLGKSY